MDSREGNGSEEVQVPGANHLEFWACKQLNSRWLIAESKADDCSKNQTVFYVHSFDAPDKQRPAEM